MRIYRPTYRQKNKDGRSSGRKKQCSTWWLEFRGPDEIVHRWGLETDNKDVADIVKTQINSLNEFAKKKLSPPESIIEWVRQQGPKLRDKIYEAGLLKAEQASSTEPIAEHLKDYIEDMSLNSRSNYPQQMEMNINRIIEGCGFKFWTDIEGQKVNQFIGNLIKSHKIGKNTGNHYASSFKSFAYWMKKHERIKEVPTINDFDFDSVERRAFEEEELQLLFETTKKGPVKHGLSGYERYIIYKAAYESGLRKNELRNLTRSSFDFKNNTVKLSGKYTKNGKRALQRITPETMGMVWNYIRNKTPDTKVFKLPNQTQYMIRDDSEDAGIETENHKGKIQFHSLRHSLATHLARKGVPCHILMKIMRHSNLKTTQKYYLHLMTGDEEAAIEKLRDLEQKGIIEKSA